MTLQICHLISGDLWAGAEVMAFHLLKGLKTLPGVELFVILFNKGRLAEELERLDISVQVIDESKQSFPEIVVIVAKIVKKWAPQILHSHRYKENIITYLISRKLAKDTVLVSTQHGMPEFYDSCPTLLQRLKSKLNYGLLARKFDRTVAVSRDIKESLISDYGFHGQRVEVIWNGIYVPEVPQRFTVNDYFVIGSAGRFFPVKDYPFMVEVAREVIKKTCKIRFELAGEGPMLRDIQEIIRRYGLGKHFVLRGFLRDVDTFYQGLDVYLNTSLHEGIPMGVLEAMAYGLPAIVPKVGGLQDIVTDGVDGYLLDARNPKDFADRCLSLYENEILRRRMARAAREKIVREFSTQRMVQSYADTYTQLIRKNGQ